ncbi:MAG: ABC transporter permease [Gemmatimonadota bacterium]
MRSRLQRAPRVIGAIWKAGLLSAVSYRTRFALSLASVVVTVIPMFFIARALQPLMGGVIEAEGARYFDFLILGFVCLSLVSVSVSALPSQVGSDIQNGFFETLSATPAGLPALLAGLVAYPASYALFKNVASVGTALLLGMHFSAGSLPAVALIIALLIITHVGVALVATAGVIAFRTTMALPELLLSGSALLGGVYWPTSVIPSWIQRISDVLPVSYGLRALRKTALAGESLASVRDEVLALAGFAVFWTAVGSIAIALAMSHARRRGSLSQY